MKEFMEEYGGVIVTCMLGIMLLGLLYSLLASGGQLHRLAELFFDGILFAFVWNRTDHGYLGALSKAEPKSFLKATDNSDFLVQLKPRPDPVLTVSVSKLKYQRRYDLLHGKEISARAVDADGRELPVSVIKLIAPDGSQLEKELNPEAFWTAQRGVYEITYQAEENYQGAYIRKVTKVCRVTVD